MEYIVFACVLETVFAVLAECFVDAPDDFKTVLLSTPHNPRTSEKETKRIKSEHPDEPGALMNSRILGALAVTRGIHMHLCAAILIA